jgi:hypothetical protein
MNMKRLVLFLLAALASGQNLARYQALQTVSLSSSAAAVTVQQFGGTRTVNFERAWVYCSVACSFTLAQNGTAATATTLAISPVGTQPASTVHAYSGSNVGTGAYVSNAYQVPAGGTFTIDISGLYLTKGGGAGQNLTIATNNITGSAEITIQWTEK